MLYYLKDEQWERIKGSLQGKKEDKGRSAENNRNFVAAVMWIAEHRGPLNMENGQ